MGRIVGWIRPDVKAEKLIEEPVEATAAEAEQAETEPEEPAEKKRKPARKEQE